MESIYNEINSVFINGQKLKPELLEYLAEIYIK